MLKRVNLVWVERLTRPFSREKIFERIGAVYDDAVQKKR